MILINFFIFLCLSNKVNAQDRRITFNNLNIEQGISQSTIDVIFQDSKGYVWFGTNDGLNKYNGYDFKVYNYEYGENSISNNHISDIDEDSHGNMWITTIGGVSKLNPKNDEIKNYKVKDNSIGSNNAMEVLVTNENKVLVATDEGLYLYEENLDKFKKVLGENNDINCQYIYSIDQDSEGNIWLGLKKGVIKVSKNFKIIKTFPTSTEKNSLGEGEIYNVYCDDENGYVWVGSASSGLSKINTKTDEITRYTHDLNDSKSIPNDNIGCIKKDSRGNVWIGTANGLAKYNKQSDNFNVYHHKIYDKNSLVNNNIKSLMEDSKGLIWVGTYSGISIFDTDSNINHYKAGLDDNYLLNENIVHGVYEDEDGYLWVGTNSKGVNIIDRKNNISKQLNSSIDKAFKNDSVNDITGKGNIIYIATDNGLIKLDKSRKILKNYSTKDGLVDNKIKDVMIDSKGYLWIGTTDGLSILNPETD
ncbi:MAG: histidine kinase, partial [Paeniclostridium sp.]